MNLFSFRKKVTEPSFAVMTGGTGGIGSEVAEILLEQGWDVLLLTRHPQKAKDQIQSRNGKFESIYCDLTKPSDLEALSASILKKHKTIRFLLHCAGKIQPEFTKNITHSSLQEQMTVNLTSPILLTSQLLPALSPNGHIIFVNSIAGVMPLQGSSIYSATKFGLRGFARSLALEFKPKTIRISSIFLAAVDTQMLEEETREGGSVLNFVSQPLSPRYVANLIVRTSKGAGREIFLPKIDGIFAHACLIMPRLLQISTPLLEKIGQVGLKRFLKKRGI
ncbi:SDR family NAD(P)-dependent oxidoreductase [Gluconobacter sp. Dm-62]|uniref:SDR family NAD(P)-dependent oxidoreductase n=1 Tax=Gluconobacter sp. Dm-62 TaxID=2799804 RepID=UPI001B8B952B|nr:SDR family NAD(P)-dependent oxidoreductase [Gluconobacter sp. Dm-62]MBS1102013.1 SDR family NAD(P)-dependent oxidoreductase [Gluconobacter sp. Dm-62]